METGNVTQQASIEVTPFELPGYVHVVINGKTSATLSLDGLSEASLEKLCANFRVSVMAASGRELPASSARLPLTRANIIDALRESSGASIAGMEAARIDSMLNFIASHFSSITVEEFASALAGEK